MTDPTPTRDEAVPPGWKLVPVEPTEAMMAVGRTCGTNSANTYRAMLASAPAPASGGVDAVALLRDVANTHTQYCETLHRAADILASLSPAATPVSEDEPGATVRTIQPLMCEAVIDFIPKQNGHLPFDVGSKLYALAKPASSPAPVRPIGNQGISDYQREIARNMAEGFAAWNAARQEALPSDEPASSPAGGDQSLGAMLNHAASTIRGLEERIALYRANYTTNSALDHGRRQIIDDFEKFLHERAALSQSTSAGRVGE